MKKITTIEQLIELYQSVYYVEDTDAIPLICAIVISARMEGDSIWLWLVGGSSAGKTCLIDAISDVDFTREVSMLTANTFLSGAKGKNVSLLEQIGRNGVITFKDWTTMLSTNAEKQAEVLGQMRQIFDGYITKATGNGKPLEWAGKVNIIAGTTEAVHVDKNKTNEMGTRQLMYTFKEQDRKMTTRRAMSNRATIKQLRQKVRDGFREYIDHMTSQITEVPAVFQVPTDVEENIMNLTDLVAYATTGVARNYRGEMELMMSPNMPMRYAEQAIGLGQTFMFMNNGLLADWGERLIYKTALDSIPKQRLITLRILAKYEWITTKAIGLELGYETDLVGRWLADLDALKIVKRIGVDSGSNKWQLKEEYRNLMTKFDGVVYQGDTYTGLDVLNAKIDESEEEEARSATQNAFNDF